MVDNFSIYIVVLFIMVFGFTGVGKIISLEKFRENFVHLHLPQWFRFTTGLIEIIAIASLFVGFWVPEFKLIGSFLLIGIGLGGTYAHIRMRHGKKKIIPIAILAILAIVLFVLTILK